jgi:uncharacterized protein (TIGR00369 family)
MITFVNKDRDLVQRFLRDSPAAVLIDSNPLASELCGSLLAADAHTGTAVLSFEPTERFVQGAAVLQGGIVAAMLDFAMAFAVWTQMPADKAFSTATLTVNLLRPAVPARYIASGRVVRMGARVVFASSEIVKEGETVLVATASAVLPVVEISAG